MTHEISSTTSCTTVTRATTLEKTRRIFKIITLESQKKWPLIIKFQLEDEACKNHRLKKRGKGEILFIFDRLFQNTFQHLPLPSQHSLFVRTPQLGPQRFPNIPQHSTCSTKKKKRFQGSTTRSSNSSLSNPRP